MEGQNDPRGIQKVPFRGAVISRKFLGLGYQEVGEPQDLKIL